MSAADAELEQRARARIGTTLRDKYRIEDILGIGGMAVVYRATHRNLAQFAIKMLHPELSVRESLRKRFLREGYAANAVAHPGVVRVVDDDVGDDGAAFLVMEMLEGQSLDALMRKSGGRVPVAVACGVLDQLLDVLAAVHERGIVHRDLKPGNLFLTTDGTLKVLDFGVARVRDELSGASQATATGVLLGTPAFMAPEQASGKSSEIDARTDLWAASATFFALVSGESVHPGDNPAQVLIAAATKFPRSVKSVAAVPEAIARVVDRGMSFDRGSRWVSAAEMREELRRACLESLGAPPSRSLLAHETLVAVSSPSLPTAAVSVSTERTVPSSPMASQRTTLDRAPSRLPLAAIGAIVLAVGGGVALWQRESARRVPEPEAPPVLESVATSVAPPVAPPPSESKAVLPPPIVETQSARPTAPRHATPTPTPAKPSCNPPFYIDGDGRKIFKKECL